MIVPDINFGIKIDFKITEYRIEVNGEPLVKPYKINIKTRKFAEVRGKDYFIGGVHALSEIIIANPKLAGEKLLDKIKEELAK